MPNGVAQAQRRGGQYATTIFAYSSKTCLRGAAKLLSNGADVGRHYVWEHIYYQIPGIKR